MNQNQLSLSLVDFFDVLGFNPNQFFDSSFWCALNTLEDEEWFEITDDIIAKIGYKGTEGKLFAIRNNTFRVLKKHFTENIDYIFTYQVGYVKSGSGGQNKMTLKMKRDYSRGFY